jgi:hypothetical protein
MRFASRCQQESPRRWPLSWGFVAPGFHLGARSVTVVTNDEDELAGLGEPELLAGETLDGPRIRLQGADLRLQGAVLLAQILQLPRERLGTFSLSGELEQAPIPEERSDDQSDDGENGRQGRGLAAETVLGEPGVVRWDDWPHRLL